MEEQKVHRKKSTRDQKIEAVEHVRHLCERGKPIVEKQILNKYGVGNVLGILLGAKVIKARKDGAKLFTWDDVRPIPEIVDSLWMVHGTTDNRAKPVVKPTPAQAPVLKQEDFKHQEPPKDLPAVPAREVVRSGSPTFNRVQGEIQLCLNRCKEYGIANVSKYIADHLAYLGLIVPTREENKL